MNKKVLIRTFGWQMDTKSTDDDENCQGIGADRIIENFAKTMEPLFASKFPKEFTT